MIGAFRRNVHFAHIHIWMIWIIGHSTVQAQNFTCHDGQSIPVEQFCNGIRNCDDGSDELMTISECSHCESSSFTECRFGRNSCLINSLYICNETVRCQGFNPCDVECPNYYRCRNNDCERRSTICDGDRMSGCEEEDGWKTGIGFKCVRSGRFCQLPQQLLWDDVQDCDQGEDLCFDWPDQPTSGSIRLASDENSTAIFNQSRCFTCLDGSMMIPRQKVCDDVIDCSDLSDECLCRERPPEVCDRITSKAQLLANPAYSPACEPGLVDCGDGTCINRTSVCDGISDCDTNIDEKFSYCRGTLPCRDATFEDRGDECRCDFSSGNVVGTVCDGVGQCPPGGDDVDWLDPPGYPDDECRAQCSNLTSFNCTNSNIVEISTPPISFIFCNTTMPAIGMSPSMSGPQYGLVRVLSTQFCDGIPHCSVNLEDELDPLCDHRFRCNSMGSISIAPDQVCDGIIDCDDASDELNDSCQETRLICPSLGGTQVSIERDLRCDFVINCDDGRDEINCTNDERFYCENGIPLFVRRTQVYDGEMDCSDLTDECPTMFQNNEDASVFSSRDQLLSMVVFRVIVWIMGIMAFVGNIIVIAVQSKVLLQSRDRSLSTATRTNHMLILNLAVADFLMGVYLIMLGIATRVYDGNFCSEELAWLSGSLCLAMGVLVVISSQTSVLTMVLLASVRLFAVLKPFSATTKPTRRTVLILLFFSWTFSLLLALIPLSPSLQYIFTTRAIIPDNLFFRNVTVNFNAARRWAEDLITFSPELQNATRQTVMQIRRAATWSDLYSAVQTVSVAKLLDTQSFIGYYGGASVCIPRLFVSKQDNSWRFSIAVTIFNFVAFIFVAFAYFMIVLKTKQNPMKSSNSVVHNQKADARNTAIQRKIYRLLVTDFCCWVPISIMVFINFSGVSLSGVAYAVSAIVLLPINSALNPILYSNVIDKLLGKIRDRITSSKIWTSSFHSTRDKHQQINPSETHSDDTKL